jgi:hypothetical protein
MPAFELTPYRLSRANARFAGPNHEVKLAMPPALVAEVDLAASRLGWARAEFIRAAVAAFAGQVLQEAA